MDESAMTMRVTTVLLVVLGLGLTVGCSILLAPPPMGGGSGDGGSADSSPDADDADDGGGLLDADDPEDADDADDGDGGGGDAGDAGDSAVRDADQGPDVDEPVRVEVCDNGVDDDGDGRIDCADPSCDRRACGPGCLCDVGVARETACGDGADNDGDGRIDCADDDCAEDTACVDLCEGARTVSCGYSYTGTTVGGPSRIESYGCAEHSDTGPEAFFVLELGSARTVQVILDSDHTVDIDLVVLTEGPAGCDPVGGCVEASQRRDGWERVTFSATASVRYHIVVDSYLPSTTDSFRLTIVCW